MTGNSAINQPKAMISLNCHDLRACPESNARKAAGYAYLFDQKALDGAVNGAGTAAEEGGQALRPVQSGKIQQYGALLFGAAAIGALVLVIVV